MDVDIQNQGLRGHDKEEEDVVAHTEMDGGNSAVTEGVHDIQHLARNVAGRFLSLLQAPPVVVTPRSLETKTFVPLSAL